MLYFRINLITNYMEQSSTIEANNLTKIGGIAIVYVFLGVVIFIVGLLMGVPLGSLIALTAVLPAISISILWSEGWFED